MREAQRKGDAKLFHNAAQAWNHAFFWECMTPAMAAPARALKSAIDQAFGGHDGFKDAFVEEGFNHFGSGWLWLVTGSEVLNAISTHDADDTLIRYGLFPLLVCDVWEHAYYLDYKNDRKAFLERRIDKVANFTSRAAAGGVERARARASATRPAANDQPTTAARCPTRVGRRPPA